MKSLAGKTAFITGGTSGIGFGMASVFASAGMNIVITDIRQDALDRAGNELREITENVMTVNVDSTDASALNDAAQELSRRFGPLHVLCNNAGVPGGGKVLETPIEGWRNTHEVNFWGPLNGVNVFLPGMLEHGEEAHIVNTASFSGIHGHGHQSGYGTSKFAIVGLSEFLRNDLVGTSVGVSVLCPHVVDTPIIDALKERVSKDVQSIIEEMAVPAETVGYQVMQAMLSNEFYIFCDGTHTREMLIKRCNDMIDAMNRQFPE
jgi:NAD(P)-dependent dehydrogenase (short-subunit alcohol dehydrogenase family)|tara:strand:- start:227 stop:1015 length:789 start_codon:yes stop_codon:yes gene_type:complete